MTIEEYKISTKTDKSFFKELVAYGGVLCLCLVILTWVMKLWKGHLTIPFYYAGDGVFASMFIKSIMDNGWYLTNPFLGMPFGQMMHDFPMSDNFHFFIMKMIGMVSPSHPVVLNLYYLMGFPFTAFTSFFVLRHFNLSAGISIVFSLLFTFLPYHFVRGQGHLALSAYYTIPLVTMVILWIWSEEPPFFKRGEETNRFALSFLNHRSVISVIVCALVGSTGVYYAFFACFFLLIAGISSWFYHGSSRRHLFSSLLLLALIAIVFFVNISPTLFYRYQHGVNRFVGQRDPSEAEIYALRLTHLVRPTAGHRIPSLNRLSSSYSSSTIEGSQEQLGIMGSIGFALLLFILLLRFNRKDSSFPVLERLSILNISAILLSTASGFGPLIAFFIFPQIRAYNRISVYIAFFSLFCLALLLEDFFQKHIRPKGIRYLILTLLLVVGIMDQTNNSLYYIPPYDWFRSQYTNDESFIKKIEASVPPGAMIFQMPYVPFPEHPPVHQMTDYELIKGYLHSQTLRWSYGVMKGREGDLWQRSITSKPLKEMVDTLALAGFNGIYLDRNGYPDRGLDLENKLTDILETKPMVSSHDRLVFFNMTQYGKKIHENYSKEEWQAKQESALHPLLLGWHGGFSNLEGTPESNWRWCSSEGELHVYNGSQRERKIAIQMSLKTGYNEISNLTVKGPFFSENIKISSEGGFFSKTITITPGKLVIQFRSDAKRVNAPQDPRYLVFRVINFRLQEME
jgi:phosphoglycerol transferase